MNEDDLSKITLTLLNKQKRTIRNRVWGRQSKDLIEQVVSSSIYKTKKFLKPYHSILWFEAKLQTSLL